MSRYFKRKKDIYRYRKLRKCQIGLHHNMTKGLSRDILLEAANDFRMLKNGTVVFDSEDDSVYLNDRLIYDIKIQSG